MNAFLNFLSSPTCWPGLHWAGTTTLLATPTLRATTPFRTAGRVVTIAPHASDGLTEVDVDAALVDEHVVHFEVGALAVLDLVELDENRYFRKVSFHFALLQINFGPLLERSPNSIDFCC